MNQLGYLGTCRKYPDTVGYSHMESGLSNALDIRDLSARVPVQVRQFISRAWLVGSTARGDATNKSDIDILVEPKNISAFDLVAGIKQIIADGDRVDTVASYGGGGKRAIINYSPNSSHFVVVNSGEEVLFPERVLLNQ